MIEDEPNICLYCNEEVKLNQELAQGHHVDQNGIEHKCHIECAFRMVTGGVGHWVDHEYWCKLNQDPDGGFTYRQSAKLVWAYARIYAEFPTVSD